MWRPHSSNVSDSEFSFFSAELKRILRLKEQPPAHCPPELVPTLQLLPWGVRDIFAYLVIEEEVSFFLIIILCMHLFILRDISYLVIEEEVSNLFDHYFMHAFIHLRDISTHLVIEEASNLFDHYFMHAFVCATSSPTSSSRRRPAFVGDIGRVGE